MNPLLDEPKRNARRGTWSSLAYRDYRVLWLGTIAVIVAQELRLQSAVVWLYDETGSAAQLGLLGLIQLVVQIPALLFGGTLADRLDRRRLVASTQAVSCVFVAGIASLALVDALAPWHIYVATAVLSVSSVFGNPARNALIAATVPREQLVDAVTTNWVTQQIATVVGPLTFAAVAEFVNLDATFVLAAGVAAPAALLPLLLRASGVPEGGDEGGSMLRRTWEGLRFVRDHPLLPALYLLDTGVTVVSFYRQLFPVLADQLYGGGAGAVGLLTAANSAGAIGGSFVVLALRRFKRTGLIVLIAHVIYALLLFPFALTPWLPLGMLLVAGLGGMDAISVTVRQATVHLTTPDAMRGRALSVLVLSAQSANNVGTLWVGMLSAAIGASSTLLVGGASSLAFVAWAWRGVRGLREYRAP